MQLSIEFCTSTNKYKMVRSDNNYWTYCGQVGETCSFGENGVTPTLVCRDTASGDIVTMRLDRFLDKARFVRAMLPPRPLSGPEPSGPEPSVPVLPADETQPAPPSGPEPPPALPADETQPALPADETETQPSALPAASSQQGPEPDHAPAPNAAPAADDRGTPVHCHLNIH